MAVGREARLRGLGFIGTDTCCAEGAASVADSAGICAFTFRGRLVVAGTTSDAATAGRGAVKVVAVFADLRVGAGETGIVVAVFAAFALLRVRVGRSEDGEDVVGAITVADSAVPGALRDLRGGTGVVEGAEAVAVFAGVVVFD